MCVGRDATFSKKTSQGNFGNTSAYKYTTAVNGRTLNIYFKVTGNHLNLAGSIKDAYAQVLLSGLAG
jgi:hypothetical protein